MLYSVPLTTSTAAMCLPTALESFSCLMVVWYNVWGQLQMATTEPEDPGTLISTVSQLVPSLGGFDV